MCEALNKGTACQSIETMDKNLAHVQLGQTIGPERGATRHKPMQLAQLVRRCNPLSSATQ